MIINRFVGKIATVIILSTLCLSCQSNASREAPQTEGKQQQNPQPKNITYGDLVIKAESDYLIIPVGLIDTNQSREGFWSKPSYYEKRNEYSNIIFYHKKEGNSHFLLNKKAVITSFDLIERKAAGKPTKRFWLYRIIENDTNGDNQINYEDAVIGYLSDLSGKNIKQITPNNTQLMNFNVIQSVGELFLKIVKDSNQDQKFTEQDETSFMKVNLDNPSIGKEIISDKVKQQIKSIK